MAKTPFTTWAELLAHLQDCYRNHDFSRSSATIAGGNSVSWSSARELREAIDHASQMVGLYETGAVSFRVYAKDGGRG